MAICLSAAAPAFVTRNLGGNAWIKLRPASSSEVDDCSAEAGNKIAGLLLGGEAADALVQLLPDLDLGGLVGLFDTPDADKLPADLRVSTGIKSRIGRLADRLTLIALIERCNDGWAGILDAEKNPLPEKPDAGMIALLLQDATLRGICHNAIFASYHAEVAEGNASAASLRGGAAADNGTAGNARRSGAPARAAGRGKRESAAPK